MPVIADIPAESEVNDLTDTLTAAQAIQLMKDESVNLAELEAMGFVVGTAQVAAAAAAPEVQVNAELTALVAQIWDAGTNRPQTKGAHPRQKRTLGDADGIAPYRVIITQAKS